MDQNSPDIEGIMKQLGSMLESVYNPEFDQKVVNLQALHNEAQKQAEQDIDNMFGIRVIDELTGESIINQPLSNEEVIATQLKKEEVLAKLDKAERMIQEVEERIDENVGSDKGFDFNFDPKCRPVLFKSVLRTFGISKTTITYEDYKKLLSMKKAMEKQEVAEVFADNPDNVSKAENTVGGANSSGSSSSDSKSGDSKKGC